MLVALVSQLNFLHNISEQPVKIIFTGLLVTDGLAHYAGLLFSIAGILTVVLSLLSQQFKLNQTGKGEYYAYLLVLLVGLNLMAKSVNLLMLFVALELVSIGSYLLTTVLKNQRGGH